jgi:hypothetical protein
MDILLIIFEYIMYHDDRMYGLQRLLNRLYHFRIILMLVTIGMLMMAISFCERLGDRINNRCFSSILCVFIKELTMVISSYGANFI